MLFVRFRLIFTFDEYYEGLSMPMYTNYLLNFQFHASVESTAQRLLVLNHFLAKALKIVLVHPTVGLTLSSLLF